MDIEVAPQAYPVPDLVGLVEQVLWGESVGRVEQVEPVVCRALFVAEYRGRSSEARDQAPMVAAVAVCPPLDRLDETPSRDQVSAAMDPQNHPAPAADIGIGPYI